MPFPRRRAAAIASRLVAAVAGLLLFVLALELLKRGAGGVGPMLRGAGVSGLAGIGAGWLGACLLLSGSRRFHPPEAVTDMIRQAGFAQVTLRKFLNGAVCMHIAEKARTNPFR